ncbi:MAG: hypothetical protein KDH16_08745 [Rhodocyclaceae bacterium]|nr:hypothetical protein [Rhodocyclaceae bacterium]
MPRWINDLSTLLSRRQILLAAALLVLMLAVIQGLDDPVGKTLVVAHFGLFLLWQPVVRARYRLAARDLLIMTGVLGALLAVLSAGVMVVWVVVLAAVVAGRAFVAHSVLARLSYQLAVVFLILLLMLELLPSVVPGDKLGLDVFSSLMQFGSPVLLLAIASLPAERNEAGEVLGGIDLLSSLFILLVLAVTVLGGIALMQIGGQPYFRALAMSVMGMAAALFVLTWAWNPQRGHAGLGLQLSRRLLSTGLSFEEWLHGMTTQALAESDPERFIAREISGLVRFPGVVGGAWKVEACEDEHQFGAAVGIVREFMHRGLRVELRFARAPSAALVWHYNLLLRVLAEFYREKCHTRELQTRSYLEAVHETGARLTHDVKNLLQSLNALCAAVERPDCDDAATRGLFLKQLPLIARRLEGTLDKLKLAGPEQIEFVALDRWWFGARSRHQGEGLVFLAISRPEPLSVPNQLYDSALENLIQNAEAKRHRDANLRIIVSLDGLTLSVEDSGAELPTEIVRRLFSQPLQSDQGLGMGLYQTARLADRLGFRIRLAENRSGCVRFVLDQPATGLE